jgi:hypothetical protein
LADVPVNGSTFAALTGLGNSAPINYGAAVVNALSINGSGAGTALAVDFSGGNPVPSKGLSFDGSTTKNSESLVLQGELPSGVWGSETSTPSGSMSGKIALTDSKNNVSTINYSQLTPVASLAFAPPNPLHAAPDVTPAITDVTPAKAVTYDATSTDDWINLIGTLVGGNPSTQINSINPTNGKLTFASIDYLNKTTVTIDGLAGDDTLNADFTAGNALPGGSISFDGGAGANTISAYGDGDYVLNSGSLQNTAAGPSPAGVSVNLKNVQSADLTGRDEGSSFIVQSWAGGSKGSIKLNGGTGPDTYIIGDGDLDDIAAGVAIAITDMGGKAANSLTLNDDQTAKGVKNVKLAHYKVSDSSITSTLQSGNTTVARTFPGVTFGSIQTVTLNATYAANEIDLAPSAVTTFNINGNTPTPAQFALNHANGDFLKLDFTQAVGTPMLTYDHTTGDGKWMFSNPSDPAAGSLPINFTSIEKLNYFGVTAVAADGSNLSEPTVKIYDSTNDRLVQTLSNVYAANYQLGVRVAVGDLNGDGIPEIIVVPGREQAPMVKVYDILSGDLDYEFMADTPSFNDGLLVAVGDVNGDGNNDIITASSLGPANVHVFLNSGYTPTITTDPFTAYSAATPAITAFASVNDYIGGAGGLAVANLTGHPATPNDPNGVGDIIVGSGVGVNASVQVFNYSAHGTSPTPARTITPLFSSTVQGGVSVAAADLNGDGVTDLVMGAGPGGASQIDVWNGKTGSINQFTAFTGNGSNAPVHVAIANVNGVDQIMAGQGTDGRAYAMKKFALSPALSASLVDTVLEAEPYFRGGVYLD